MWRLRKVLWSASAVNSLYSTSLCTHISSCPAEASRFVQRITHNVHVATLFSFTLFNQIRATNNWKIKRVHVRTFNSAQCVCELRRARLSDQRATAEWSAYSSTRMNILQRWLIRLDTIAQQWCIGAVEGICVWRLSAFSLSGSLFMAPFIFGVSFCVLTIYRLFVSILLHSGRINEAINLKQKKVFIDFSLKCLSIFYSIWRT